ncbi:MAG: 2OG-Fe(II) oxygenase [Gammaproteobacteria bacterium]|nr:MAG: 2OG-Fe(II) oxygenase [Gammaproteobacteria bacterium]
MQFSPYQLNEVKPGSFVFEVKNALPAEVCHEAVRRFELLQDEQYPGRIGQMAKAGGDIKKTTDLVVSGKENWRDLDQVLFQSHGMALAEIRKRFPYFKGPFKDMGYNLQRYQPGEYYDWHIDGGSHQFAERQLVALWYLNEVEEGGRTDFRFQDISVAPETGKLVLFPPFWTHEHRAAPVARGVKYIATTWLVFR